MPLILQIYIYIQVIRLIFHMVIWISIFLFGFECFISWVFGIHWMPMFNKIFNVQKYISDFKLQINLIRKIS